MSGNNEAAAGTWARLLWHSAGTARSSLPAAHLAAAAAWGARQRQQSRNQALKGHFFHLCWLSHSLRGRHGEGTALAHSDPGSSTWS